MGHKVFIPVTDELLFDQPELISAPLQPYSQDMPCYHWMDVRLNPADDAKIAETFHRLTRQKGRSGISLPNAVAA
jgi:hypothetical protein